MASGKEWNSERSIAFSAKAAFRFAFAAAALLEGIRILLALWTLNST